MDGLNVISESRSGLSAPSRMRPPLPRRSKWKGFTRLLPFLMFVVIPTLATTAYYVFVATDQYVSEAKFVVRGPAAAPAGMLTSLLQTAGGRSQDDTYAVQEYMLSRDALEELVKGNDLKGVFARPEADILARFPLFLRGDSFEHLYDYYKNHIDVELDSTTGVSTLTVRSFRAADSQNLAKALLAAAEGLVNRINDRQRENAMRDARKDIAYAERRVEDAATEIATFRNREAILDPTKQSVPMLQGIFDLQTMLTRTQIQLSQITASSRQSPMISEYRQRINALQAQIKDAKTKITGSDSSLVPKITAYDRLTLQREFADKALTSATASMETARIQAERQQLYLEPVVAPNLSDYPAFPKATASIAMVFASLMGAYFLLALVIAGAREHKIV